LSFKDVVDQESPLGRRQMVNPDCCREEPSEVCQAVHEILLCTLFCCNRIAQCLEHTPRLNEARCAFSFNPFPLWQRGCQGLSSREEPSEVCQAAHDVLFCTVFCCNRITQCLEHTPRLNEERCAFSFTLFPSARGDFHARGKRSQI